MAPKLFMTGTTGFIGGTVLDTIVKAHPEYEITVLLRTVTDNYQQLYPNVHIVQGDFDSSQLIAEQASKADIVVHCGNSDHIPSLSAIISGLTRPTSSKPTTFPKFLMHLSGTGIVSDWHTPTHLGTLNPKIWSDVSDLDAITSLPERELHRPTDKLVLAAAAEHSDVLKTAIVCPPDIYGPGRGPGKTQTVFWGAYVAEAKRVGAAFYVGDGGNTRSWVHVEDLMVVYLGLVEAAARGGVGAEWGAEGYYFTSTSEASQLDVAKATGRILKAKGVLADDKPKQLSLQSVREMLPGYRSYGELGVYLFASNSRTRPHRAERLFGYKASQPGIWDVIEAEVQSVI